MSRKFTDGDRIKPEICYDREYREIVIDLRVESISSDIEIRCKDFDHRDRYKCCEDLPPYLSESIGIDFLRMHGGIIEKRSEESKEDISGLEK